MDRSTGVDVEHQPGQVDWAPGCCSDSGQGPVVTRIPLAELAAPGSHEDRSAAAVADRLRPEARPVPSRNSGSSDRGPCHTRRVGAAARERARGEIVRLVHGGLGVLQLAQALTGALRAAVPFDGMCVVTLDPVTGVPTGEVVENGLPVEMLPRLTEIELGGRDVNTFAELAHRPRPVASLSASTRGELDRSLRQRELRRPAGFADELRAALVAQGGAWGALTLMRGTGRAHFTAPDVAFVGSMSGLLAEGLRRAQLLTPSPAGTDENGDSEPGLLLLADDDSIDQSNPAARRWLRQLGTTDASRQRLPVTVRAVAQRARDTGRGKATVGTEADPGPIARALVRTVSGRWLHVHGSLLGDGPTARAAVILEPAGAPELAPLVADAYGLTGRERWVTELVAAGLPTDAIARRLQLSPYTVQDHLKAIFEKTGVGARGELVARLFLGHSPTRLRSDSRGR